MLCVRGMAIARAACFFNPIAPISGRRAPPNRLEGASTIPQNLVSCAPSCLFTLHATHILMRLTSELASRIVSWRSPTKRRTHRATAPTGWVELPASSEPRFHELPPSTLSCVRGCPSIRRAQCDKEPESSLRAVMKSSRDAICSATWNRRARFGLLNIRPVRPRNEGRNPNAATQLQLTS